MKMRFVKYGSVDMFWSLIPVFPVWTIIPGLLIAMLAGDIFRNCEIGFEITKWLLICISLLTLFLCRFYILDRTDEFSEKKIKSRYRLFNLLIYSLINTLLLILIIGTKNCCEGDGQTFLAVIFSGPIASLTLPIFGLIADLLTNKTNAR